MPAIPAMASLCHSELSNCLEKPDKLVKLVLRVVSKLCLCLREHNQVNTNTHLPPHILTHTHIHAHTHVYTYTHTQWNATWQDTLIGTLHPISLEGGCGEVMRRECEGVKSELEREGEGEGEGGTKKKRKKRGPRKRKRTKKI